MDKNCENCGYWQQCEDLPGTSGSGSSPNAQGECRIRAPKIDPVSQKLKEHKWPRTAWCDWCGEFKRKGE